LEGESLEPLAQLASLKELVVSRSDDAELELHIKQLLSSAEQGCLLTIELPYGTSGPVVDQIKAAQAVLVAERGNRKVPLVQVQPRLW
jgi:hypothetical protein